MRQNITNRSRNLVLATLLSLALLPTRGLAEDPTLRLDQLRPGQTHIGSANIQNIVDKNTAKTADNNSKKKPDGTPVEQLTPFQTYKAKMDAEKPLPVVLTPDGNYIMLDGHHRTTSYYSILEEAQRQWDNGNHAKDEPRPEMPSIKVTINKDHSKSWKEFSKWMVDNHKVYFDQDTLKEARKKRGVPLDKPSDEEFIQKNAEFLCRKYLPNDYKGLTDSPMRSVVGTVLYDLNDAWDKEQDLAGVPKKQRKSLDGSNQKEYIEFLIGDHLKKKNIEAEIRTYLQSQKIDPPILKGHEYNEGVLRIIEDAIFNNQAEHDYLSDSCRRQPATPPAVPKCTDADQTAVESAVVALTAIHSKKRATSPGAQPNANPAELPPPLPVLRQGEQAAPVR